MSTPRAYYNENDPGAAAWPERRSRDKAGRFARALAGEIFEGTAVYHDRKGYACVWLGGKNIKVHILVWERANGAKPEGHDIHHKDEDKGNYALENLELVTVSNHRRIHAGWIRKNGGWVAKPCNRCQKILPLAAFYPRKGHTPTALCKTCHNTVIAERSSTKRRVA